MTDQNNPRNNPQRDIDQPENPDLDRNRGGLNRPDDLRGNPGGPVEDAGRDRERGDQINPRQPNP